MGWTLWDSRLHMRERERERAAEANIDRDTKTTLWKSLQKPKKEKINHHSFLLATHAPLSSFSLHHLNSLASLSSFFYQRTHPPLPSPFAFASFPLCCLSLLHSSTIFYFNLICFQILQNLL